MPAAAPLLLAFALASPPATASRPVVQVEGRTVRSERDPAVTIRVPEDYAYAGGEPFELGKGTVAEAHVFVRAGPDRRVQGLYWIQLEGALRPYRYPFTRTRELGGLRFDVSAKARRTSEWGGPGSDTDHVLGIVRRAGYSLPDAIVRVRLVHLADAALTRELMIIYVEDLASTGFPAKDVPVRDGDADPDLAETAPAVVERAIAGLEVRRAGR